MTKFYYEDKTMSTCTTKLVKTFEDNGRFYVQTEDTVFYPQGGGQKGDRGTLVINGKEYKVLNSIKDENYDSFQVMEEPVPQELIGAEVTCILDTEFRHRQMMLHTVLHIHHVAIQEVLGHEVEHPTMSTIEDGYAVNKYKETAFDYSIVEAANARFYELLAEDLAVTTYADKDNENFRYWECKGVVIPCGGIHVDHLGEIAETEIETGHRKKAISIRINLK